MPPGAAAHLCFRGLRDVDCRALLVTHTGPILETNRTPRFVPAPNLDALARSPIVEIAHYRVDEDALSLHAEVLGRFAGAPGCLGIALAHCPSNPTHRLDLLCWESEEAHDQAPEFVRAAHPQLKRFFDGIETVELLALFVPSPKD